MTERVYVDRIEEGRAVLLAGAEGREKISLPARMLPEGCGEGAALDLSLAPAPEDTTRQKVAGLLEELFAEGEVAQGPAPREASPTPWVPGSGLTAQSSDALRGEP